MSVAIASFIGGMNNLTVPELLSEREYQLGVNGRVRGGRWKTRPRFKSIATRPAGILQGVFNYRDVQYFVIAGSVYRFSDGVFSSAVSGVSFHPRAPKVYATETPDYLVISDCAGNTGVVGDVDNRMTGTGEINQTGLVAYGHGRIVYTDIARLTLMASDIYVPGEPASVLGNSEQQVLNEGLYVQQPAAFGKINAMTFIASSESGDGLGALIVFYERGVIAYNLSPPRVTEGDSPGWLDRKLSSILFRHDGCGGALLSVDSDIFYRTMEGVSTFKTEYSASSESVRTIPMTMPITPLLSRDPAWASEYVSMAHKDNTLYFLSGMRVPRDPGSYFDTMISMDFAAFYAGGETATAIDGMHTGARYQALLTGQYKGRVELFVVTPDNVCIYTDEYRGELPRTRMYTRRIFFGDAYTLSKPQRALLWFEGIKSDLQVKVYYRIDSPLWRLGGEGEFKVGYYTAAPTEVDIFPQSRGMVNVPLLPSVCDPVSGKLYGTLYEFCIEMTGIAELSRVKFDTSQEGNAVGEQRICEVEAQKTLTQSGLTLYEYDELD